MIEVPPSQAAGIKQIMGFIYPEAQFAGKKKAKDCKDG
jgi:hypothetical protein